MRQGVKHCFQSNMVEVEPFRCDVWGLYNDIMLNENSPTMIPGPENEPFWRLVNAVTKHGTDNFKAIGLSAAIINRGALKYASTTLQNDRQVVGAAVQQNGYALQHASGALKDDGDVVRAAVQQNGRALAFASAALQNDSKIVSAACRTLGTALQWASNTLKNDREVVLAAVLQNGLALQYASDELKDDRTVASAAIMQNGLALQYASDALQSDHALVSLACTLRGEAIEYTSPALKHDSEMLKISCIDSELVYDVENDWNVAENHPLRFAPASLRNNREFVLAAVGASGFALKHASDALQNDREVVLSACMNSSAALLHASTALTEDQDLILVAVAKAYYEAAIGMDHLDSLDEFEAKLCEGEILPHVSEQRRTRSAFFILLCGMAKTRPVSARAAMDDHDTPVRKSQRKYKDSSCLLPMLEGSESPIKPLIAAFAGVPIGFSSKALDIATALLCAAGEGAYTN